MEPQFSKRQQKWTSNSLQKMLFAFGIVCCVTSANAQYSIYHGSSMGYVDKIYPSVATVFSTDPATNGAGYVISSTAFNSPAAPPLQGELIRTNASGTPLWARRFNVGGNRYRFNHIEAYQFNNAIEYLVVGSRIDAAGINTVLVARVSDAGNVLRSVIVRPLRLTHLMGIKGIATSDGGFAIVASECSAFDPRAAKYSVVLKMDINLALQKYHTYNTPNVDDDFDFPTGITEGASSDEFMIVGTSNKNVVPMIVNSQATAMSTLIRMSTGAVVWSYNRATLNGIGWDAAADGYYNSVDSTFWVLANDPNVHSFNLTQLNRTTGTLISQVHFIDKPFGHDLDYYGFELKPSLSAANQFVIGGWKISGASVMPFMIDVNPYTRSVKWERRYTQNNNQLITQVENDLLKINKLFYFPVFYGNIMAYNTTKNGYVILGSDSTNAPNIEAPQLWRAIDLQLKNPCSVYQPTTDTTNRLTFLQAPLSFLSGSTTSVAQTMSPISLNYQVVKCSIAPISGIVDREEAGGISRLFPNPASAAWNLESSTPMRQLKVYDMYGREVMNKELKGTTQQQVAIGHLPAGMYLLKIVDEQQQTTIIKAQVLR